MPLLRLSILLLWLAITPSHAQAEEKYPVTAGPRKGTLIVSGGGAKAFDVIFGKFIELAGGADAPIVIIPTAASSAPDFNYLNHRHAKLAREKFGLTNFTMLHTHDRVEADTKAFVEPLRSASGIWFTGGRQWRLYDAYGGTRTEREFRKLLQRDGIIGGGSAGATIQGSFLVRGDTSGPNVLIGDHQQGFGFIANSAIDQHLIPRKREFDLIEILGDPDAKMDPNINREALLGIGLDEDTAILVRNNRFEVFGKPDGVVLIYDPHRWKDGMAKEEKFLTLKIGDKYDLAKREKK